MEKKNEEKLTKLYDLIGSITSVNSKFEWTGRPPLQYNSSDFLTQLRKLKGTSGEFSDDKGVTVHRVQIHRNIITTKPKGVIGNMVICEEAIIQLQRQDIDNTKKQKEFRNTAHCLVLTAKVKVPEDPLEVDPPKDPAKEHRDSLHILSSIALSMRLSDPPFAPLATVDKGDDTARTFGWLLKHMSNATSNKDADQEKAIAMFGGLIEQPSAAAAAKEAYNKFNAHVFNWKMDSKEIKALKPTPKDLLKHSFVAHTKAFMISPETEAYNVKSGRRVAVQRSSVVDWTSSPSFGLILVTLQGGKKPFNWIFIKTYSIQDNAEMNYIIERIEEARQARIPRNRVLSGPSPSRPTSARTGPYIEPVSRAGSSKSVSESSGEGSRPNSASSRSDSAAPPNYMPSDNRSSTSLPPRHTSADPSLNPIQRERPKPRPFSAGSLPRDTSRIEKPDDPANSNFTPTPPLYDFAFNHLTGCSSLPEELELELELL